MKCKFGMSYFITFTFKCILSSNSHHVTTQNCSVQYESINPPPPHTHTQLMNEKKMSAGVFIIRIFFAECLLSLRILKRLRKEKKRRGVRSKRLRRRKKVATKIDKGEKRGRKRKRKKKTRRRS